MDASATFLFAGGGTGGHLFPGIAVAEKLRSRDSTTRIIFVGSTRAIESSIIAEHDIEHRMLPVEPLTTLKPNPVRFAVQNWRAWRQAGALLSELRPDAVIGLGGFASAPIVLAARRQRIPIILLEQNVIPGRTTRWLCHYATKVCVSFEETCVKLPRARSVVVTGNPVRAEIAILHDRGTLESSPPHSSMTKPELLILGGSQGADSLNDAVLLAIRKIRNSVAGWNVVHQAGPRQVEHVRQAYEQLGLTAKVEPFFHDLPNRYSNANLVISRAGATTLAELACAGVAMILLPYPYAADDHQRANAQAFVDHSAAVIVNHASVAESTADELSLAMRQLVGDGERRLIMGLAAGRLARPRATGEIADVIIEAARRSIDRS